MWIKICANTCAEDALKAAELGTDAVGFVFAPSSRRVTAGQVRAISEVMPEGLERVGVFGEASAEEITEVVKEARLTAVQLHGGLDLELAGDVRRRLGARVGIIHTLHWSIEEGGGSAERVMKGMAEIAESGLGSRVLVDARAGRQSGGTGRTFDWESARGVLMSQPTLQLIVAGGLQVENVGDAIKLLAPFGVDVASGVERTAGTKDFGKMERFIENARRA